MIRRKRRHGSLLLSITAALLLFWLAGLVNFLDELPDRIDDKTTVTDAIVVLTGGSMRLKTGLTLLQEERAEKLFVSGVHRGVDVQQLLRMARQSPNATNCCIFLGHEADDTAGNAIETSIWMAKHGYLSMRLVTAAYHMPRSLLEFSHVMPNIKIIIHPVFPVQVKLDAWWRWPGTAGLIFGEYSKYLIAHTRHIFANITS
ncbi:MAG: YdcF family protein [Pseudomonadota bacterium]|nr:YdcF family protein [Pseudomonadota bacterium]